MNSYYQKPEIEKPRVTQRLRCSSCGKSVSSEFYPVKTDTPDGGIVVRAYVHCLECIKAGRWPLAVQHQPIPPLERPSLDLIGELQRCARCGSAYSLEAGGVCHYCLENPPA